MKPKILVARPIFEETLARLRAHFEVTDNQADVPWTPERWAQALSEHDGVLTNSADPVNAAVLAQVGPRLKAVANMAVGYNNFDLPALTARHIQASNTPDVLTETTADFGFALLMATARRVSESEHFLRRGDWKQWRYDMFAGAEVHGSTLGVIGMGRIGQGVAKRGAHGFGMKVIYHNRSRVAAEIEQRLDAAYRSMDELLAQSDFVVLQMPYSPDTHHLIDAKALANNLTVTNGSQVVTTTGDFTNRTTANYVQAGDVLSLSGVQYTVVAIDSATSLRLTVPVRVKRNIFYPLWYQKGCQHQKRGIKPGKHYHPQQPEELHKQTTLWLQQYKARYLLMLIIVHKCLGTFLHISLLSVLLLPAYSYTCCNSPIPAIT